MASDTTLEPNGERGPRSPRALRPLLRWPLGLASAVVDRLCANFSDPATVLPLVLIGALAARVIWLDVPHGSLIFDETYYVNAARILLGLPVAPGDPYADAQVGLDPNTEHPPLGKLLIALSMTVFGDNGFGWRLPSLIAGMISLGTVYLIVRAAGEGAWLGILAVALLAFDNLTMVHGRIGTLDMLVLTPMLLGAWLALRDRWLLAGVALAVAILVKLTAVYGVAALLAMLGLRILERSWRERRIGLIDLRRGVGFSLAFGVVAIAGLWLLDLRFTSFATPFDHLRRMVEYGANLRAPIAHVGFCPSADSSPWQWLFNECQINYLRVDVTVRAGQEVISSAPTVDFRGALNPLLVGAIPLATLFTVWYAWRTGSVLGRWSVVWAAANYLPYVALGLFSHRIMYIYYFLPLVPAVAVAVALLLARGGLPRFVMWAYLGAYLVGFAAYFPFRQLP